LRPGGELLRFGLAAGKNLDVCPTDINHQNVHDATTSSGRVFTDFSCQAVLESHSWSCEKIEFSKEIGPQRGKMPVNPCVAAFFDYWPPNERRGPPPHP